MGYVVQITARAGDGCEAALDYELEDGVEPKPGDVGAILYTSLADDETGLLRWLMTEHAQGGHEKLTITAQMKVRP